MENTQPLAPDHLPEAAETLADTVEDTGFGDILRDFETQHTPERDEVGRGLLKGTVLRITPDGVVIDIGRKMEGILALDLVKGRDGTVIVQVGQQLEVNVAGRTDDGYYRLTVQKVEAPKDWSGIEQAFESKAIVTGTVLEVVKGGLRVDVGERAFMPASRSGARDVSEMAKLVGQKVECRITKFDKEKEDVVVDRRVILEELAAKRKQEAFASLAEGTVLKGRVRTLTDFGAFVSIGDVDGLLHVSDMSWTRIAKPADLLKEGDEIEVKILKINPTTRKISLGLKQLQPEPWAQVAETFSPGQRVQGKVMRLTDFGAFVELLPGIEGLVRMMDMTWDRRVRKPEDVVKVGDVVEVQILDLKPADKKIGLGLKQLVEDPWAAAKEKYPLGSIVEAVVTDLQKFGAFVSLGAGVEGMVHVADITREKRIEHPKDVLAVGQTIKAAVTEFEAERRRIRLSIKQLEPTNADHFIAENAVGDVVTARVSDVREGRLKVQLAEGVTGHCALPKTGAAVAASAGASTGKVDISSLGAMLNARWKEGTGAASEKEPVRVGQIRQFKILAMDKEQKRIDVELID
ncbi:S1 RNA-binding domain-containing protein [Bryobacter aggregatus]|uniref:S1 RNA-binding domain-containing protein n=1 Tax=Bryobacter aggregatus TaxID=360054 RepID=UPI0009B5B7C7|nr:S1 RNA-binding domain-containing protein [Bryobacter aggregatus]